MRRFTNPYFGRRVVRALHSQATTVHAETLAYAVMPDHLHWLLQLRPGCKLGEAVQSAKGRSALEINRARASREPLWQPNFRDHALRSEEDLQDVARYVECKSDPCGAGSQD